MINARGGLGKASQKRWHSSLILKVDQEFIKQKEDVHAPLAMLHVLRYKGSQRLGGMVRSSGCRGTGFMQGR